MTLTKKGEYALRTLISLGVAHRIGRKVLSVSEIALQESLPFKFLEAIVAELKKGGFIINKRGKDGGAMLAKQAYEIKVGEVIRFIDGKLAPIGCASESQYKPCTCPDEDHCGLRMIMIDVRNSISKILDRYTLEDIVNVTIQKMERDAICIPFQQKKNPVTSKPTDPKPLQRPHALPEDGLLNWLNLTTS